MQRHLKPPPKVIPPKPPAHLFDPNYDVINERYQPREEPERFRRADEREREPPASSQREEVPMDNSDFERDVAEQMRELESNILKIMTENKIGEPSSSSVVGAGDPFAAMKQYDSDRDHYSTGGKASVPLTQEAIQKFIGSNYSQHEREQQRGNYSSIPSSSSAVAAGSYKKQAAAYEPSSHYPPQKSSPVKRMGAINNLFGNESDLTMKAEKQAAYSQQLLKDQQKSQQLLQHHHNPTIVSQQQHSSLQRPREDERRERDNATGGGGGTGGLQIGHDRQRELEIKKAKQMEYRLQLDSQQQFQHHPSQQRHHQPSNEELPAQHSARREEDPYYRSSERKHMGQQPEREHIYHPSERKHVTMQESSAKMYPSHGSFVVFLSFSLSFSHFVPFLLLFSVFLCC
jgi:hypothetical protein